MELRLSKKMLRRDAQEEFVREMLRAAGQAGVISFAGGLPNPVSFPVEDFERAAGEVLREQGTVALQYSETQGYEPLRRYIAERYGRKGVNVTAADILITNGSQQALDMLAAALLDDGDAVLVEKPAYLSALQCFHLHGAAIHAVDLDADGISLTALEKALASQTPKFFYAVPEFQNPTGRTYTEERRDAAAALIKASDTLLIEDNPYGELRFRGQAPSSFHARLGDQCVMLGTFSKIVSPGMRIGWICCANRLLMEKLKNYKQIVDLHTNIFGQMVLFQYLDNGDLDAHIETITRLYRHQAEVMLAAMRRCFPGEVSYAEPEGGMFLWATLPEGLTALDLSRRSAAAGVAIAAGDPFYEREENVRSFRLNYTNCSDARIAEGIERLGGLIRQMQEERGRA